MSPWTGITGRNFSSIVAADFAKNLCFTNNSENVGDGMCRNVYLNMDFGWTRPTFDTTVGPG